MTENETSFAHTQLIIDQLVFKGVEQYKLTLAARQSGLFINVTTTFLKER